MLTDEQAKELVTVTICRLECKLPRVYVDWVRTVNELTQLEATWRRIDSKTATAEVMALRTKAERLRNQMRRLDGFE